MEQTIYPVQTENVCYEYEDADTPAVDHVSLDIEKGSFVAVLGHNGSGKSTLAKMMNALYLPTKGRVLVCGLDTSAEEQTWTVRRHAGMVFQNPDNQIVANVVREDVAFGLENLGVPQPEMIPRIDAALEAVRMTHRADFAPHMLSGGQKQRVAIARMLMEQTPIKVFDDSLSAVDAETDAKIRAALKTGMSDSTVILISHRITTIQHADCIIVLDDGHIAQQGTHDELCAEDGIYRRIWQIQNSVDDMSADGQGSDPGKEVSALGV